MNDFKKKWKIVNEIIGRKAPNIDSTLSKNFSKTNETIITNNFALSFNNTIANIVHECDEILCENEAKTYVANSLY